MSFIKIITVMDNLPSEQKALKAEHGLSFYVETDSVKILFDFGAGEHAFNTACSPAPKSNSISEQENMQY